MAALRTRGTAQQFSRLIPATVCTDYLIAATPMLFFTHGHHVVDSDSDSDSDDQFLLREATY